MSGSSGQRPNVSSIERELYFLIERFLTSGPCKNAANVLRRELDEHGLLPIRTDWEGQQHKRSFESLLEINRHIGGTHLLKICQRLGPLLDEKIRPCVMGVSSLLGAGSQSLLRTEEAMSKLDWLPNTHCALQNGCAKLPPVNLIQPNTLFVRRAIEMTGQSYFRHNIPVSMYDRLKLHSRKLGHLSAVYCVLFDRTGNNIFTGADDLLVKVWQAVDGRLKATLRGHNAEITDMDVNFENTLLASGSCDKTIRVWCLKTKAPVAVLQGHSSMITSLQFSPYVRGTTRYLASTGGDACVCFWEWNSADNKFNAKPVKYIEKSRAGAQVLCSSFSAGGMFFAAGSTDHVIRMYHFPNGYPEKIGELEKHTDRVDSMCYANNDNRFLSGSRDGTARIWKFERCEWRCIILQMGETLKGDGTKSKDTDIFQTSEPVTSKLRVTMVGWNNDDTLVFTAISDYSLKVWCSYTGDLKHILKSHQDEVFVLEPSPLDTDILVSAGHDGKTIIWDLNKGIKLKDYFNMIEGQGHGAVFDCKFSPDGTYFASTDSHGHLMIYGFGSNEKYKKIPEAVFFHTDYRPLIRDSNNYVLDEQTQQAPHLMPAPFLVDIDGNPYQPEVQRLVPGREKCRDDQLIPQLAVNEDGEQEVMGEREPEIEENDESGNQGDSQGQDAQENQEEQRSETQSPEEQRSDTPAPEGQRSDSPAPASRPSIDALIEELQRQQDQRLIASGEEPIQSPPPPMGSPRAFNRQNSVAGPSSSHMVGMRRDGETEGVRQSLGNIQQVSTVTELAALSRRIVVKEIDAAVLRKCEQRRQAFAELELRHYIAEKKKKILVVKHDSDEECSDLGIQTRKKKTKKHSYSTRKQGAENEDTATNRLTTRALYDTDEEVEENMLSTDEEEESVPENICIDTSDLSDWGVGTGSNLEPPKRKSTRVRKRKKYSSSDETDEEETGSQDSKGKEGKKTKRQAANIRKHAGRKAAAAVIETQTPEEVQETLRQWRPPDWLTDVIPRKQPYFPQMGDELMYFRQGHELYVSAVERRETYPIDAKKQPWYKNPSLRYQEAVRIVGVRYELLKNGIRLCCLKLNYIDPVTLKNTGGYFNIKYHDMADVVDFLVLKQNYDLAMTRNWKQGDRFRSMIDDSWWIGVIEQQIPFQEEYPDSMFQCFKVRWDNAEKEYLSPWDLEPVVESRNPSVFGGGILVTQEELKSLMYKPKPNEWPNSTQDETSERLVQGLEQVMSHSVAEPFLTPVDLNVFPSYAMSIEYPMDLNTIKRRLENRFYRRLNAVQFDVRHIESNARKFNEPRSQIVKSAQILTDALLMFLSDTNSTDACQIITKLSKGRKFQWSESDSGDETEDYDNPDGKKKVDGGEPGTSKKLSTKGRSIGRSLAESLNPDNWKPECQRLLETIFQCEDSGPFREPVDINEYPNYYEVIEYPMDLAIVQENLSKDFYSDPNEFARDVRLVFSNSKSFNTNKRSRIYTMTLRLSAMFEAKIKEVIGIWKRAVKYKRRKFPNHVSEKPGQSTNQSGTSHPSKHPSTTTQPSTSSFTNGRSHSNYNSKRVDYSKTAYAKNRPKREIKPVKKSFGYDSDLDNQEFPDPKPDYSDDDFEIQPKTSPKKRGSKSESTNGHTNGNRYSTRVKTGIMKPQKYEEEFSEEEEEEVVSNAEKSDSDVDPRQYTKIILKSKPSKKRGRKRKKPQYVSSRISSKKIILSKTVVKKTVDKVSESSASSSHSQSSSSSLSSSSEDSDMYEEIGVDTGDESELTEPCSPIPVSRSSQGTSRKNYSTLEESDSSLERQSKKKIIKQKVNSSLEESDSSIERQSTNKNSKHKRNSSLEESDSSIEISNKKKNAKRKHSNSINKSRGRRPARQTRNQGKRTVVYREEDESENSDNGNNNNEHQTGRSRKKYNEESEYSDSPEDSVSISMRGRIRRPTARARALHDK